MWYTFNNIIRWKVLTWESDSSHGSDNAVVRQECNYNNQKISVLYHVIRQNYIITVFLWWYHSLWSFKGKNIMNQNCFFAINPWWVSHLWLIKNSIIHFWGTSCLVCPTSLPKNSTLSVECFSGRYIKVLSNIYRAPFNNCISLTSFFSVSLLRTISAAPDWFCSMRDYSDKKIQTSARFILHRVCFQWHALSLTISPEKWSPRSQALPLLYADRQFPLGSQYCSHTGSKERQ